MRPEDKQATLEAGAGIAAVLLFIMVMFASLWAMDKEDSDRDRLSAEMNSDWKCGDIGFDCAKTKCAKGMLGCTRIPDCGRWNDKCEYIHGYSERE